MAVIPGHTLIDQLEHELFHGDACARVQAREALEGFIVRLWKERADSRKALLDLRNMGGCWCEKGLGNPMVTRHTKACERAHRAID